MDLSIHLESNTLCGCWKTSVCLEYLGYMNLLFSTVNFMIPKNKLKISNENIVPIPR